MALYELRTYTLRVGAMTEAVNLYPDHGAAAWREVPRDGSSDYDLPAACADPLARSRSVRLLSDAGRLRLADAECGLEPEDSGQSAARARSERSPAAGRRSP
jgi:hypothetical protein